MPPRIGRPKYDEFRANEVGEVPREIREFVDNERIHEKELGQPGRPPCKRRDIIKCLLLIELLHCVIQESWSLLNIFKDTLGLEKVPRPRTLYQYRADPGITATLQRLQRTAAWELWMKERIAAMDPTGNPLANGKAWSTDRTDPKKPVTSRPLCNAPCHTRATFSSSPTPRLPGEPGMRRLSSRSSWQRRSLAAAGSSSKMSPTLRTCRLSWSGAFS